MSQWFAANLVFIALSARDRPAADLHLAGFRFLDFNIGGKVSKTYMSLFLDSHKIS